MAGNCARFFYALTAVMIAALIPAGCENSKREKKDDIQFAAAAAHFQTGTGTGTGTVFIPGTDKWYIDFDNVALIDALATLSLPPESAEEFKQKCIYYLWQFFDGLPISFSAEPPENGVTPAPGECAVPTWYGPNYYNTLRVWRIYGEIYTGRAMIDYTGTNGRVENDSGLYLGEHYLGVFVNQFANYASLGGLGGNREECAKWLAVVIAHEVGHSLGIVDHDDTQPNIMASSLPFDSSTPSFTAAHRAFLEQIMPGPWRF